MNENWRTVATFGTAIGGEAAAIGVHQYAVRKVIAENVCQCGIKNSSWLCSPGSCARCRNRSDGSCKQK